MACEIAERCGGVLNALQQEFKLEEGIISLSGQVTWSITLSSTVRDNYCGRRSGGGNAGRGGE